MQYIISVKFMYGPFTTKSAALEAKKSVKKIQNAVLSPVTKSGKTYKFTGTLKYSANDVSMKNKAVRLIKQNAPTAHISVLKR